MALGAPPDWAMVDDDNYEFVAWPSLKGACDFPSHPFIS